MFAVVDIWCIILFINGEEEKMKYPCNAAIIIKAGELVGVSLTSGFCYGILGEN